MHPHIHISIIAMLVAIVVSHLFGWFWFGPFLGKKWNKMMCLPECKPNAKIDTQKMCMSVCIALFGTLLTTFVMSHHIQVWRPSVWSAGADNAFYVYGFCGGFFTWLGFYVPVLLGGVAWENKSWRWCASYSAYHFINLQLIAMIIAGIH